MAVILGNLKQGDGRHLEILLEVTPLFSRFYTSQVVRRISEPSTVRFVPKKLRCSKIKPPTKNARRLVDEMRFNFILIL